MGVDGLFASLVAVFQAFALLWIAVIVTGVVVVVRTVLRSRESEWLRSEEEVERLEQAILPVEKPEQAA
jgi:hypothetical protein